MPTHSTSRAAPELRVPLLDVPVPRGSVSVPTPVSSVSAPPRKSSELPFEQVLELGVEDLIDYCEERRRPEAIDAPLKWQHVAGPGTITLMGLALIGYHVYRADSRSAARAVSMFAPPPFPGFNDNDTF